MLNWGILLFIVSSAVASEVPQIQVQGNCDIKVMPDRGSLTFSAENQARDQLVAIKKTNDQINQLKIEIEKMKLRDVELKNTNYNVFPIREYEKDRYVDKGTKVSLSLELTTSDIARLGETMVKASQLNIQSVSALRTFLSLENSQKEYLRCLEIAASDAEMKAQKIGKKLGFKIGDVVKLIESPRLQNTPHYPEPIMLKSMVAPTTIETSEEQFSTTLQVSFAIK